MDGFESFLTNQVWLASATWLGLLVTVGGLAFTVFQVIKARRASEAAREASRRTADMIRTRQKIADASDGHAELLHARKFLMIGEAGGADHCLRRVHRLFSELKGEYSADPRRIVLVDECIERLEATIEQLESTEKIDRSPINTNLIKVERVLGEIVGHNRSEGLCDD